MVRVRLRYADLETFIERFAPNVTRGGIFLASRTPRAVGEIFPFEVQLAGGSVALAGEGKVIWVKPFNPAEPQKPHGMGVQFVNIDPESRSTLGRILESKGSGPLRIPRETQPLQTLSAFEGTNGRARIDTSVDLASEYGIDEQVLRRVIDRNWTLGSRADDEIQDLLKPDPVQPPVTLAQALADLPRLLDPAVRRRSGALRSLESLGVIEKTIPAEPASPPAGEGASHDDPNEITFQEPDRATPPQSDPDGAPPKDDAPS
jgi:uncharacterized protein (TIGR02266 family)